MARSIVFWLSLFVIGGFGLYSQTTKMMKANSVSIATYKRDIPPLSKMKNIISAKGMGHVAPPKRRGANTVILGKGFPKGRDPLMVRKKSISSKATGVTVASFDAHAGSVLNDATGAIGPNHYMYAFNTGFGILDREGTVLLQEASLGTLFPGETLGDPIVIYDNFADRFVVMEFSNSPNGFLIAVCKGPDPVNDGWSTYRFNTGDFPDYEKLSIWNNGYYITTNKNRDAPTTNDVVFVVERDKMIEGEASVQMIGFPLPGAQTNGFYSPGGFNATGSELPPIGVQHAIVFMQDDEWSGVTKDHLKIWNTNVDWNSPENSTISQPQELLVTPFDGVFDNGSFQNLEEPGNGADIDALQATMMYMTNYRRFATHNSVVLNFVVDLDGTDSLAGIRWYELRQEVDGDPWTVFQEGTYVQPDGLSAFCGSIGMDVDGNIGLAYTVVGPNVYTSLRYTGRLASDPLGYMTVEEQVSANGDRKNNRSDGRYGDYGQLTVDPLDDKTFWHISEYMKGPSSIRKSHVVAFRIDSKIDDIDPPSSPHNLVVSEKIAKSITLDWEASVDNVVVKEYYVFQDDQFIGTTSKTRYTIKGLTPQTSYSFYVLAKDLSGNQSTPSNTLVVSTPAITIKGCIEGVSVPYYESFEKDLGSWTQVLEDDLDWVRSSSSTQFVNIESFKAYEGESYVFIESSNNFNKKATLDSPCFDLMHAPSAILSFNYYMNGDDAMGSLEVEISNDKGVTWNSVWKKIGNQDSEWKTASIDLSLYRGSGIQLRFSGRTGNTEKTKIAIDAISIESNVVGAVCVENDLQLSVTFDKHPEETSWVLMDEEDKVVASERYSSGNTAQSTVVSTINDLKPGRYTFVLSDSFGDGICCEYGMGSYYLSSNTGTIISGGNFTDADTVEFCVQVDEAGISTYELADTDKDDQRFILSPNPVRNDILNIAIEESLIQNLEIFSMYGTLVKKIPNHGAKKYIDVSGIASGRYFMRITSKNDVVTRSFIKN